MGGRREWDCGQRGQGRAGRPVGEDSEGGGRGRGWKCEGYVCVKRSYELAAKALFPVLWRAGEGLQLEGARAGCPTSRCGGGGGKGIKATMGL